MLELDIPTIVFEIINFLALSAALYYLVFRPVMRRVEERAQKKERLVRQAEADRREAERLKSEWESKMSQFKDEAAEIVDNALEQIEAERQAMFNEVREEAERTLNEARNEARRLQQKSIQEYQEQILDTIISSCRKILGDLTPPKVHETLVDQINEKVWEMGRDGMRQVENLRRSLGERSPTAYAESARDLSDEQQRNLMRTLSALADRDVNFELKTDPSLAAGMRIRLGDLQIDNTIASKLDEMRQDVSEEIKEQLTHVG